ncbi:hypothetical protein [Ewingella americana]|uniref:hypothetical protein n=1 Tax=Ewingella americana TaxID=41202 RepID=UPI0016395692|nr:hypothetical protein [Ewingella americana]QMV51199.1 hypothetical protein GXP68_07365 [Ewingella americana]
MMKIKPLFLCVIPLALVASFAYGNYGSAKTPIYVKDAVASVSSKMSYSFGMSKCLPAAEKDGSWQIQCSPAKGGILSNSSYTQQKNRLMMSQRHFI